MEYRLELLRTEIEKIILKQEPKYIPTYLSHMYGVTQFCTLLALKRNLNAELAATCGVLHDIFYMSGNSSEYHAEKGAKLAKAILEAMELYRADEIQTVTTAIAHHSDKAHVHGPYDELLKDADVLDHCLYNTSFPIAPREQARFGKLQKELGLYGAAERG